ncbi:uncharacterized protein LOC108904403 [Anoplophora glabripennis]|uniref:uncharacterized protein LOC108904403 n=1 Tax=Anoplophora glabripennis TaxID=217634 RepID=UPI0008758592|nr:uncharacterized protein LOC108904403 [Anoplophora glabripennis]
MLGGSTQGYYWRDYTGMIPEDAVEGGHDKNNIPTYIGQVYVHNFGISTVTIYPGKTCVTLSVENFDVWNYIKILCSPFKENFKWVSADAKRLHVQMTGKHLVPGGVEWNGLVTNIGRILYQGELLVAKVCGFNVGNAKLYYRIGNGQKDTDYYEILTYDDDGPDPGSIIQPR